MRILPDQQLKLTDAPVGTGGGRAATAAQETEKCALEVPVECCIDDWIESARYVAEPQEYLCT
jgi:hypothetical protein